MIPRRTARRIAAHARAHGHAAEVAFWRGVYAEGQRGRPPLPPLPEPVLPTEPPPPAPRPRNGASARPSICPGTIAGPGHAGGGVG